MRSEEQIEYAPFEDEEYISGGLVPCETAAFESFAHRSRRWFGIYSVCEGEVS